MSRLQAERNERMKQEYERGDTMTAIAGRHGITTERVRQILRRMGVPARGNMKLPAPAEAGVQRTIGKPRLVEPATRRKLMPGLNVGKVI